MIHSEPSRLAGIEVHEQDVRLGRVIQKYCLALRRPIGRQTGRQIAISSKPPDILSRPVTSYTQWSKVSLRNGEPLLLFAFRVWLGLRCRPRTGSCSATPRSMRADDSPLGRGKCRQTPGMDCDSTQPPTPSGFDARSRRHRPTPPGDFLGVPSFPLFGRGNFNGDAMKLVQVYDPKKRDPSREA
jgi:hypothetical protein